MSDTGQLNLGSPEASTLTETTICLHVEKGRFGVNRKVDTEKVTVDADKRLLAVSKCILDSPELKAVATLDSEVQTYLREIALKSMFSGGIYLIPLAAAETTNAKLTEFADRRRTLVEEAVKKYDQRVDETAARLRVLRNEMDYPSEDRFRGAFYFEWKFRWWETPTKLKSISAALFEREREKAAAEIQSVAEECKLAMRAGLRTLVDHMIERLTPGEDGKPKRFQKSTVENLHEFLQLFDVKNVTNDAELAAIVTEARAVLAGVDAESLRKNDALREAIMGRMQQLQGSLEAITVDRGTRAIDLEEEDDDLFADEAPAATTASA